MSLFLSQNYYKFLSNILFNKSITTFSFQATDLAIGIKLTF